MHTRNMRIFETVLKRGMLELPKLQQCWESANKDLRFSQHKDIAKVIVAKNFLTQEEINKITNIVDEVVIDIEEPMIEATEDFFKRMEEISYNIEKVRFREATEQIRGITNFKLKAATEQVRIRDIKIPKIDDDQEIKETDLKDLKSKVQRAVSEFTKEEEVLDIEKPEILPVTRKIFYVILVLAIIGAMTSAVIFKDILF